MSGFGLFEANVTSDAEQKRQVREASNKLAAATYDVRERFGQFLFAARDLAEYNDRLALSKNDILKTIEPHVFPRTGTVRRVLKPLEREFKALRRVAISPEDYANNWAEDANPDGTPITPPLNGSTATPIYNPNNYFNNAAEDRNPDNTPITPPIAGSPVPAKPTGDPQAFKDGGPNNETPSIDSPGSGAAGAAGAAGSAWKPNGNTEAIGAGDYEIQTGDTLTSISDRSGISVDDLAKGNNIADPDMIYAGDSLTIPGGSDTTTPDTIRPDFAGGGESAPSDSTTQAPLAAESASTATPPPANETGSLTDPGLTTPSQMGQQLTSRRAARRRRADFERNLDTDVTYSPHEGELEPEGDFKGYLSEVSQGAEEKADHNFDGTFPGGTEHDMDPAKTDFAKSATRRFARWCKANRVTASLATLESYSPSDREYIAIAATLQRVAGKHNSPWDKMPGNESYVDDTEVVHPPELVRSEDYPEHEPPMMKRKRKEAAPGVPGSKPKGPEWTSKGKPRNVNSKPDLGTVDDAPTANMPGGTAVNKVHAARRRYAALCRQQGVRPTEAGFRRWAGKHNAPAGGRYYDPMEGPGSYAEAITNQKGERLAPAVGKHYAPEHTTNEFGIHDSDFHRGDVAYPPELTRHDTAHGGRPTMKRERLRNARRRTALGDHWTTDSVRPTPYKKQDLGDWDGRGEDPYATFGEENEITLLPGTPLPTKGPKGVKFKHRDSRRRIAAPDYLQKADEALTNLLNQKAEEFQQTIAPLQQALQTVQQAEAEAQAQNPLNVLPPAGTVNVLPQPPGGDPNGTDAGAGGGGMDPNALMALMGGGGGDPSMGGGDPAAGGGAPPGMDPAAMGGAPPAAAGQDALPPELMGGQQMQARRRGKARGANAPRTAKNVDQLWEEYTHQTTLRGGEPDVETFAQKYKVGPRALQRIRQKSMGG